MSGSDKACPPGFDHECCAELLSHGKAKVPDRSSKDMDDFGRWRIIAERQDRPARSLCPPFEREGQSYLLKTHRLGYRILIFEWYSSGQCFDDAHAFVGKADLEPTEHGTLACCKKFIRKKNHTHDPGSLS